MARFLSCTALCLQICMCKLHPPQVLPSLLGLVLQHHHHRSEANHFQGGCDMIILLAMEVLKQAMNNVFMQCEILAAM